MPTEGMVKLLKKLILLFLPFLIFFLWLEIKARHIRNSFSIKIEGFQQRADSVKVLVLGSSHAMKGLNPGFFSLPGFNFSNSSQTLEYDSRICLKYLPISPELKIVIIDITYISFFFLLKDSPENWKDYFYYQYFGIKVPAISWNSPSAYFRAALYRKGTLQDLITGKLDCRKEFGDIQPNGWERTRIDTDTVAVSYKTGSERADLHQSLIHHENLNANLEGLENMISVLSKKGIKVYLISCPVYHTYTKYLSPATEAENLKLIQKITQKFSIPYYDFSRDPRFDREDFFDNDHLNSKGAEKFSMMIDSLIIQNTVQ